MFDFTFSSYMSLIDPASLTVTLGPPLFFTLALAITARPQTVLAFISQSTEYFFHLCLITALPLGLAWVSLGMFLMLGNLNGDIQGASGIMLLTGVYAGILFGLGILKKNQGVTDTPQLTGWRFFLPLIGLLALQMYSIWFGGGGENLLAMYDIDLVGIPLLFLLGYFALSYLQNRNIAIALEQSSALVTCLTVIITLCFWFFASSDSSQLIGITKLDAVKYGTLNMHWGCLLFAISQLMKLGPCYEDREYEIPEALKYLVEACTFFIFLVFTPRF